MTIVKTAFNLISPALFLGGLLWSLAISVDSMTATWIVGGPRSVEARVTIRPHPGQLILLAVSGTLLVVLLLYLVVENVNHP